VGRWTEWNIPQNPWLNVDRVDLGEYLRIKAKKKNGEDGSGDAEGEGEEDQVGVGRVRGRDGSWGRIITIHNYTVSGTWSPAV
jgi:hypothetical protein